MVTPGGNTPSRTERAVIWMLCQLLPEGFQTRQHAEWTGDLIAMSGSGAGARRRYLMAVAWTLPALRAHARKPGVDHPHAMVPPVSVTMLVRVILIGLGVPVLSWLIAWAVVMSSMLLTWIGLTAAVLAASQRRADRRFRVIPALPAWWLRSPGSRTAIWDCWGCPPTPQ